MDLYANDARSNGGFTRPKAIGFISLVQLFQASKCLALHYVSGRAAVPAYQVFQGSIRSMKQKRLPGPAGTSCLTCKRRRKKCDQGRPACQKCTEGGYVCLGYDHIHQRRATKLESGESYYGTSLESGRQHLLVDISSQPLVALSYGSSEPSFYGPTGHITSADDLPDPSFRTEPCSSLVAINNPTQDVPSPSPSNASSEAQETPFHVSNRRNFNFLIGAQTAQTLSILSPNMRQMIHYVLNQYDRVLDSVYFKPKSHQVAAIRQLVVTRLQASSITRCGMLLVIKMIKSVLDGEASNNQVTFKQSVERFEGQLHRVKAQYSDPVEIQYLLNGLLEATFLKMRVSNGQHIYQLLQNAAPTFLEIVYSDPNLWPNPNGPPMACMSKVATSTRVELGLFAFTDIICSMAYGLPQIMDYETSTPSLEQEIHPVHWIHYCPLEFQVCIAEMNQCCSRSYVTSDWHVIEHRLLTYQARGIGTDTTESWKAVASLAVVESWRQVLLIYLYMAVCGVSSDDIRVQSAVRQTFRLFKTIKREEPPKMNVHIMLQYLIAGACTRNEKQRAFARERLLDSYDNEFWLLPGSEFVPVLDHLWHGAAANGRPIKWSDYITSRQVALPVLL
ncbi:hypothetical protein OPQ81_010504 [Rhizoctonia solani]|nr:hypothetical protein OPQ81_010504 [Rhizoctonia solani]